MTGDQLHTYLAALASSVTIGVLVPLLILVGIALAFWLLVSRAQRDPAFDISNVLRDETGKESATRVVTFGAFAVTSWVLAVVTFAHPDKITEAMLYYLIFWSGAPIVVKFAERWNGSLPFAKGPQP